MSVPTDDLTTLLAAAGAGDQLASNQIWTRVYNDLRDRARIILRGREAPGGLQPTVLVHELYGRLTRARPMDIRSRTHFFALAARAMRQILVDHLRRHYADSRGGSHPRSPMTTSIPGESWCPIDLLVLDDALTELERLHPRQAQVVEMKYFGGMEIDEIAGELGVSPRTVDNWWATARAWLSTRLEPDLQV